MSAIAEGLRAAVVLRAQERCEYCHVPTQGQVAIFPVDHVVPRTLDGRTEFDNLALACPRCNAYKWSHTTGIDPETNVEVALFNPRTDTWREHFAWSADQSCVLAGETACGRATIARLQMNHPDLVATRRLLAELGLFLEIVEQD